MSLTTEHWDAADRAALERAESYADLFSVAKGVISRMRRPVAQVCGPISTGGTGSLTENIARISREVDILEKQGVEIFNQIPFQLRMQEIRKAKGKLDYDHSLLTEFYLPIFESGLVQKLYFLPDWETSVGTRWEHEQALRLGMDISYIERSASGNEPTA